MADTSTNPLASFHDEIMRDHDYTLPEALTEARRCLHCKVPLCRQGCPIENEIPQFIQALAQGNFGTAAEYIYHRNNLPAICGRVCPRENQCEGACVLNRAKKPIQIGKLERFVADLVLDNGLLDGKKKYPAAAAVAIVGSGPAGLAAAYDLRKAGYGVTVFEQASQPGGTIFYGIPTFRLHKEFVVREAAHLEALGVTFVYNTEIGEDKSIDDLFADGFAAVFIAVGTMDSWGLGVKNYTIPGVVDAASFLQKVQEVQLGEATLADVPIRKGDTVAVIGAGNVAIDAARTALRLQAEVTVVYRRAEKNMKCLPSEYEEAKEEGIHFQFYSDPTAIIGVDTVEGLQYERQEILEDATMVPTGEFGVVKANKVIAAIGNRPQLSAIRTFGVHASDEGYIAVSSEPYANMTDRPGVFAAGDIVHKPQTVVLAMREGKKAAAGIAAYLQRRDSGAESV